MGEKMVYMLIFLRERYIYTFIPCQPNQCGASTQCGSNKYKKCLKRTT